jgi:hypothetical protein
VRQLRQRFPRVDEVAGRPVDQGAAAVQDGDDVGAGQAGVSLVAVPSACVGRRGEPRDRLLGHRLQLGVDPADQVRLHGRGRRHPGAGQRGDDQYQQRGDQPDPQRGPGVQAAHPQVRGSRST